MKAAYITDYGDISETLRIGDLPRPKAESGDLLVEVRAASVNPVDWKLAEGMLRAFRPLEFPAILGYDFSGVVLEGSGRWQAGDEVYGRAAMNRPGSFAEYIAVEEKIVAMKPKNLDFIQAAAVPLAALTAWQALFENIGLQPGQRILIHGGLGGVGSFAVQFAKIAGAEVATTVGPSHVREAISLGADLVIDYKSVRFEEAIEDYDAVLDTISGETQARSLSVLKKGGILVSTLGITASPRAGVRMEAMMSHPDAAHLVKISELIEGGKVHPVIDRIFSFLETKEALLQSRDGHAGGKIVIRMK